MIGFGLVANLIWVNIIVVMLSFLYLLGLHIPLGCDIYSIYSFGFFNYYYYYYYYFGDWLCFGTVLRVGNVAWEQLE